MTPRVSVIIPTYNRAALLREAVDSVLQQTFVDWELIVVDDGSTDGTAEYLASVSDLRVRVARSGHSGNPNTVRNAGLAHAIGRYVAFLDSDDWWSADKLARQVAALESTPGCGWSYTGLAVSDSGGTPVPPDEPEAFEPKDGWILEAFVSGRARIQTSTVMAERTLVDDVGRFDDRFVIAGDFDLWIRLAERSRVVAVPGALTTVRRHSGRYGLGFTGARPVLRQAFAMMSSRLRTGRLRRRFAVLCARGWVNVADSERHARKYRDAFACLAAALPWGLPVPKWWIVLGKTVLFPMVPRR